MVRRDEKLIRELMLKLESIHNPPAHYSISMHEPEIQFEGYTPDDIYSHLHQIDRRGYIIGAESGPMDGIGFRDFTDLGHDYLDEIHAEQDAEAVPQSIVEEIKQQVADMKRRIAALESNSAKAEIEADLDQITIETDRPEPKTSAFKSFFGRLREDLFKAGAHEAVTQAIQHAEAFARLRGWL